MLKRAGFLLVTLSAVALTTACSTGDTPVTPPAGTPVPAAPTRTTGGAAPARTTDAPQRTAAAGSPERTGSGGGARTGGDPGDSGMLAGLGEDADWAKYLGRCPDARQKTLIQKVVTGDVNLDGTADAVVGHACSGITSYWPSEVTVFDGASQSTAPRRLGTLLTDVRESERPYLDRLRVTNGTVEISAYGVDEHTAAACPSIYYSYEYRFAGGRFTRTAKDAGNAGRCPDLHN